MDEEGKEASFISSNTEENLDFLTSLNKEIRALQEKRWYGMIHGDVNKIYELGNRNSWHLHSVILMDPFQLRIFHDSIIRISQLWQDLDCALFEVFSTFLFRKEFFQVKWVFAYLELQKILQSFFTLYFQHYLLNSVINHNLWLLCSNTSSVFSSTTLLPLALLQRSCLN